MATSEAQKRATRKWEKENSYKVTIQFYNNKFPKSDLDKVTAKLKERGISRNEFIHQALRKVLEEGD